MLFPACISVGDIISRLSADTTQVSDLISNNINVFLRSIVKSVGFFIFMFGMSWKLTLVTIMGFPFIAVVSKLYGDYYKVKYIYELNVLIILIVVTSNISTLMRRWCQAYAL